MIVMYDGKDFLVELPNGQVVCGDRASIKARIQEWAHVGLRQPTDQESQDQYDEQIGAMFAELNCFEKVY